MSSQSISSELTQRLEREANHLTVEKLKTILRHSGLPVSGNKSILLGRIRDELYKHAQTNPTRFHRLRTLIQNPDKPQLHLSNVTSGHVSSGNGMPSYKTLYGDKSSKDDYRPPPSATNAAIGLDIKFKSSPFYEFVETLCQPQEMCPREQSRDTLDFNLKLRADVMERMQHDSRLRVLVYCGADESVRTQAEVSFPNSFDMKVNQHEVKANFRGLKNKYGTTRPADITRLLSMSSHQVNRVWVSWALTTKRYALMIILSCRHDPLELVQRLREAKNISKSSVIREMSAWAEDNDIITTSSRMSLKCPLSTLRIENPCRSRICKHNQCFDALSFLQLQEQAPQWTCPVCSQHVEFDKLQIDEYVDEILKQAPRGAEQVSVEPDGSWTLLVNSVETSHATNRVKSFDDTALGDDLIEVMALTPSRLPKLESATMSSIPGSPPSSSRELSVLAPPYSPGSKRRAPLVIDLTGDTEDDEEAITAQPGAKKQHTDGSESFWTRAPKMSPISSPSNNRVVFPLPPKSNKNLPQAGTFSSP